MVISQVAETPSAKQSLPFAITLISIVPVRSEPREGAEQCTQMLFSESCKILDTLPRWLHIRTLEDNQEGYVDSKMLTLLTEEQHQQYISVREQSTARVSMPLAMAVSEELNQTIPLSFSTLLPDYANGSFHVLGATFRIDPAFVAEGPLRLQRGTLLQMARFLMNTPYLWGGKNALGMDCSGFTQTMMSMFGFQLPRNASEQAGVGEPVKELSQGKSGDLVFFDHNDTDSDNCDEHNNSGDTRITHVGILLPAESPVNENTQASAKQDEYFVLHCSGKLKIEPIDQRGIFGLEQQCYTHHLASIRRL